MYYKITNTECKLYKQLYALRTEEHEIEESNKKKVKETIGDDWDEFLGRDGQQNYWRVTQYTGFKFNHPESLPPKTWKEHKEYAGFYIPDNRTKNGKKITEMLDNLPHSSIKKVFGILECELYGKFAFPFVEICDNGNIVVFMSDRYDLEKKFKDIIEITTKEFYQILEGDKQ
ncbi:MAG: hypothetical protein IKQ52_09785 [Bacteroidales bacterium]|nr:hypothetical protein [Bacteroidales bacterium]